MKFKRYYDLSRLRVLIVDDNKHMQLMLKEILRAFNIREFQTADDGADALKLLQTYTSDLIICDWNMSPLDGIQFLEMVRKGADSRDPTVAVIMLTGHTEYHRVLEARDAGANFFLAKPVSPSQLYARIVRVIEDDRAFIQSKSFVGPDRRHPKSDMSKTYRGPERRKDLKPETLGSDGGDLGNSSGGGLTQAEIEALLSG